MAILYQLTFPNGKSYLGISSGTLAKRLTRHRSQARRPGREFALQLAIRKYGEHSFSSKVLVIGTIEYVRDLEVRAIAAFGTLTAGGYNVSPGGEMVAGIKRTPEQLSRMVEIGKARAVREAGSGMPGTLGYKPLPYQHTPEARAKISGAQKNHRPYRTGAHSEETKKKMSVAHKGHPVTPEVREKISAAQRGRSFSAAHVAALSASHQGKPWSEKQREVHMAQRRKKKEG